MATDRVPAGKRDCISLREKIAELQKDIHDGIDVVGKKMTLCQLYAKQNAQRPKVRKTLNWTQISYGYFEERQVRCKKY